MNALTTPIPRMRPSHSEMMTRHGHRPCEFCSGSGLNPFFADDVECHVCSGLRYDYAYAEGRTMFTACRVTNRRTFTVHEH